MKLEKIFTKNKKKIKKDVTDSESYIFTETTIDTTSSENTETSNSDKENIECNQIDKPSKKFDVNKKLESLSKKKKSETSTTIEFEKFINNRRNNISNAKVAHSASKSLIEEALKNINSKKKKSNNNFDNLDNCDNFSECSESSSSSSSSNSPSPSDCNIIKLIIKFFKILLCEIYKLLVIFWKYFKIVVIFLFIKIIIFIKWLIKICHEHCHSSSSSSSSSKCKSNSSKSNIICTTALCKKPFDNDKSNKKSKKSCSKINYNKCIDLSEELKTIKKNDDTESDRSIFLNKKDYEKWVNNNKKINNDLIKQEKYVNNKKKFSKNNSKQKSKINSRSISKKFVHESSNDLNNSNIECNTTILNEIFNTMNYKI